MTSLKGLSMNNIKFIIDSYPYNDYRNYPLLKEEQKRQAMYLKVLSCLGQGGEALTETYKGEVGIIILRELPWDSSFFNIPMASIDGMFLREGADETLRKRLLDIALDWMKKKRIKHISFKVDTADTKTVLALQKMGFYLVDTIVTHLYVKGYTITKKIKPLFKFRAFEEKDYNAVMDIVDYAFKGYKNRFTNDPYLPKDRMLSLYKGWVENFIKREDGYLIVAERGGRVVGFLGYFCLKELCEVTSRLHVGKALSAAGLKGMGCYPQFISCLGNAPFYPDTVEGDASINNTVVQKTWTKIGINGSAPLIKTKYVFHYWLK